MLWKRNKDQKRSGDLLGFYLMHALGHYHVKLLWILEDNFINENKNSNILSTCDLDICIVHLKNVNNQINHNINKTCDALLF